MPSNKNALVRYIAIDRRLRTQPMPTLECLIEFIRENVDNSVSKRTLQLDIQEMRYSSGLSFNAPIKVKHNAHTGKRVYFYSKQRWTLAKRIQNISEGLMVEPPHKEQAALGQYYVKKKSA